MSEKQAGEVGCPICAHAYEMNLRILKHESETWDHDADGRCCLIARMTPANPAPTTTTAAEVADVTTGGK